MGATKTDMPLRSSCDWCRSQKLRCVQTSKSNPNAPCQRCLKSKPPKACHFSTRSRSGRLPKSAHSDSQSGCEKIAPNSDVPWTNIFTLSSSSSSLTIDSDPPREGMLTPMQDKQGRGAANDSSLSVEFLKDTSPTHVLTTDSMHWDMAECCPTLMEELAVPDGCRPSSDDNIGYACDSATEPGLYEFGLDIDGDVPVSSGDMLSNLGSDWVTKSSCGIVDLTDLLADMSNYHKRILMISGGDLDTYPIGDALFLSQRFHTILTKGVCNEFVDTFFLDAPTTLVVLSCYTTLTRIYSSILDDLIQHLLKLQGASQDSSSSSVYSYRGLCLGQFQPSMEKDLASRARKAVFLLLGSLKGSEKALSLQADVRITEYIQAEFPRETVSDSNESHEWEGDSLFRNGAMVTLTNSPLHEAVREQSARLKDKIKQFNGLLKQFLDI